MKDRAEMIMVAIEQFRQAHGFSPTVREVGDLVGLTSTSSVISQLEKLRKQGRVSWEPGCARTLKTV